MQPPADEVRARKNNGSGDVHLGEAWRLHKTSCGVARQAWCELRKHDLGWELLLFVDASDLRRSAVCAYQATSSSPRQTPGRPRSSIGAGADSSSGTQATDVGAN